MQKFCLIVIEYVKNIEWYCYFIDAADADAYDDTYDNNNNNNNVSDSFNHIIIIV